MDEVLEPDRAERTPAATGASGAPPAPPDRKPSRRPSGGRRWLGLEPRILAICVCVALIAALAAGLVASMVLSDDDTSTSEQALEEDLPDPEEMLAVPLTTADGRPSTLAANLDGRPMVLNIWSHTCAPCVEEMPLLEAAHLSHGDIAFLGVATQDRPADATALAEQTGITYPWVLDPAGEFFHEAGAAGMPTTLLLDERGRILGTRTGVFSSQTDLDAWIRAHRPQ